MNNYSFLDSASGTNNAPLPRPPPSPSPSQASAQQLGLNGTTAQNGIPMVNGMPSGGQQTDMNHLWSVVQQLSAVLEENKAQTLGIVNGVAAIQARAAEEGGAVGEGIGWREVNGELNTAARAAELSALQSQLSNAQNDLTTLTGSHTALQSLVTDYEAALTLLLDKLRPYAYNQTSSILALHKHYQGLLEQERATSMQLRVEHAEWQAGLGRVAEYARTALKAQTDGDMGLRRENRELKEENRVLRRLVGWEERPDSGDEEDKA